jgi:hypothetical protein
VGKVLLKLVIVLVAFIVPNDAHSQTFMTIPEGVAHYDGPPGGPMYRVRIDEVIPLTLDEMVRRSELIVEGTLRVRRTYLSDDQQWIYTEYEVTPSIILANRQRVAAKRPGRPETIMLKQSGGRMVVNGLEVVAEEHQFRLLPTEEPIFLFLTDKDQDGTYEVVDGAGAVVVRDSQVKPWLKTAPALKASNRAGLIGEINRELRAGR